MKPQPKTVRAWAFAWQGDNSAKAESAPSRERARRYRAYLRRSIPGSRFGPVVRIEVPAPKERKR